MKENDPVPPQQQQQQQQQLEDQDSEGRPFVEPTQVVARGEGGGVRVVCRRAAAPRSETPTSLVFSVVGIIR